jgi:hypothetical protein
MTGLQINPTDEFRRARDAAGTSTFGHFTAPLAARLRGLHWWTDRYESSPFGSFRFETEDGEERLDALIIVLPSQANEPYINGLLFRPGTLPDLARYLHNDWIDLVGIDAAEHDPVDAAERLLPLGGDATRAYFDQVARCAELFFRCVDGWYWEMFARDPEAVALVRSHVEASGGRTVDLGWEQMICDRTRPC